MITDKVRCSLKSIHFILSDNVYLLYDFLLIPGNLEGLIHITYFSLYFRLSAKKQYSKSVIANLHYSVAFLL